MKLTTCIACVLFTCFLPVRAAELSDEQLAVHILNRLAYGPAPGDLQKVKSMGVDAYIAQQLQPESIPMPPALTQHLQSLTAVNQSAGDALRDYEKALAATRDESADSQEKRKQLVGRIILDTASARVARAIESPRQLEEVMVDFWFNHFNVFRDKGLDRALIASYERDAIRPYVFGHFRDLLGATAKHPAMLFYLDNWLSSSADYDPGKSRKNGANGPKNKATGLNENYARELMELHTLGVDGGYTQKDVTELARMLTGWSFNPRELALRGQGFHFDAERHDNGDKEWLGKHIGAQGQREGEFALDVLAMHPATAHHLSFELAQYFVSDQPPPELVDALTQRYLATQGDIRAVLQTLFASREFRSPTALGAKYKTPYQFVISAARAGNISVVNVRPVLGLLNQMGMPLYGCQTPDGYKNTETAWLNPDGLNRRITVATALALGRLQLQHMPDAQAKDENQETKMDGDGQRKELDARDLLASLGSAISLKTVEIVKQNPERLQASMILGSPDFMQH